MGHILGLRDSNDRNAIMYKGHNPQTRSNEDPQLTRDDIDGIRVGSRYYMGGGEKHETPEFREKIKIQPVIMYILGKI